MRLCPKRSVTTSILIVALVLTVTNAAAPRASAEPYCEIVPRAPLANSPPYPHNTLFEGNTIEKFLDTELVWFDVYFGGWGSTGKLLRGMQCAVSLSNVGAAVQPNIPCAEGDHAFCESYFGPGVSNTGCYSGRCAPAFQIESRRQETLDHFDPPPGLFLGATEPPEGAVFAITDTDACNTVMEDPGVPLYMGSFVAEMPINTAAEITFRDLGTGTSYALVDERGNNCQGTVGGAPAARSAFVRPRGADKLKTRFITIDTTGLGVGALRVRAIDVAGFPEFNGEERWAGEPYLYPQIRQPVPQGKAAELQCDPLVRDWSQEGVIDIGGSFIVPGLGDVLHSTYEVEFVTPDCLAETGPCDGPTFEVQTAYWGDVVAPFAEVDSPFDQPDIQDFIGVVDAFISLAGAPTKAEAAIADDEPNGHVDPGAALSVFDILSVDDSFAGRRYTNAAPQPCP